MEWSVVGIVTAAGYGEFKVYSKERIPWVPSSSDRAYVFHGGRGMWAVTVKGQRIQVYPTKKVAIAAAMLLISERNDT